MAETYTPRTWQNGTGLPLSAANLNAIEQGIETIDQRVAALESSGVGGGIPATVVDAKGDLIAATTVDAVARLAVGADGSVLTANSATTVGLSWSGVAMTGDERTKLLGVAAGATANSSDATLLNRANHTGAQAIATVTGLQAALDAKAAAVLTSTTRTVSYTLTAADVGVEQVYSSGSAGTLTIPTDAVAATAIGGSIPLRQSGAGQLTVAPASGVTLVSRGSAFKLAGQHAVAEIRKIGANSWLLYGDIAT